MGMLFGKEASNIVVERNLFAHNVHRNPVIDAGLTALVVNNLIYNPGSPASISMLRKRDLPSSQ
jgi:hypothetical protein